MPDRYIDRVGVVEEEAIQSIRGDELSRAEVENRQLKAALGRLEAQQSEVRAELDRREQADALLAKLISDPQMAVMLAQRARERGFGRELMGLGDGAAQNPKPTSIGLKAGERKSLNEVSAKATE